MRGGRLTHWLTFEILGPHETDSDGATEETWIPAFVANTLPAEVTPMSGRELLAADAIASKVTHRLRLRYRPELTADRMAPRMRARERTMVYNIEASIPDPDSGMRYTTLLASTGVSPGN